MRRKRLFYGLSFLLNRGCVIRRLNSRNTHSVISPNDPSDAHLAVCIKHRHLRTTYQPSTCHEVAYYRFPPSSRYRYIYSGRLSFCREGLFRVVKSEKPVPVYPHDLPPFNLHGLSEHAVFEGEIILYKNILFRQFIRCK